MHAFVMYLHIVIPYSCFRRHIKNCGFIGNAGLAGSAWNDKLSSVAIIKHPDIEGITIPAAFYCHLRPITMVSGNGMRTPPGIGFVDGVSFNSAGLGAIGDGLFVECKNKR